MECVSELLSQELNMQCIAVKFVPRLLSNDRKEHNVVCSKLKEQTKNDPNSISTIITSDESSVYGNNPEMKQQSSQWKTPNSPQPKKARQVRNNVKSVLICFFDTEGIVHKEFVPSGQTVNGNFYCDFLRWLRENVWHKRPVKWRNNSWALHHDNAAAHTSLHMQQLSTSVKTTVIPTLSTQQTLPPVIFSYF
jgi:hypothetical protein